MLQEIQSCVWVFFRQISNADYRASWKIRERNRSLTGLWQNVSAVKPNQGKHGGKVTFWVKQAGTWAKTGTEVTWACVSAKHYVPQLLKQIPPRPLPARDCQNLQKALACSICCWKSLPVDKSWRGLLVLVYPMPLERGRLSSAALLCCCLCSQWVQISLCSVPEQSPRVTFKISLTAKDKDICPHHHGS